MTDPYDEIPLPSVGVLTDAETIKQLREDMVRQYIAGMKELCDKLIRSQAENASLKDALSWKTGTPPHSKPGTDSDRTG